MLRRSPSPSGFTLIELLVTIAVMSTLMGMLLPVIAISRRYAHKTHTEALLRKVDTALRLFKTDTRVFPWDGFLQPQVLADGSPNPDFNVTYPDVSATPPTWSNRLFYHLGTQPSAAVTTAVLTDADAARAVFDYDLTNANGLLSADLQEVPARYRPHAFLQSDRLPYRFEYASGTWNPRYHDGISLAATLNRMAQERYPLAMLAGAVRITGPVMQTTTSPNNTVYASANPHANTRATTSLLAAPASAASPGWADDYLKGELEPRNIVGDTIVDFWRRPLIYVCQVIPGCEPISDINPLNRGAINGIDETLYGLGAHIRRPLTPYDAYGQQHLIADGSFLPDPANRLRSDIRRYAAPPFALEFELWSAGPDVRFAWMRDEAVNHDNIAVRNYLAGLR